MMLGDLILSPHLVLLVLHELVDEVRADEASSAGDQDPHVGLPKPPQSPKISASRVTGSEIQQRSDPERYLEELGEADGGGSRRRARGGAVAIGGVLLRHRAEHLHTHTQIQPGREIVRSHTTQQPNPTQPKTFRDSGHDLIDDRDRRREEGRRE